MSNTSAFSTIYTDPMYIKYISESIHPSIIPVVKLGLLELFLIPLSVMFLFWGIQLLTGILLQKAIPNYISNESKRIWKSYQIEQKNEWEKNWDTNKNNMRKTGIMYLLLSLIIMFYLIEKDKEDLNAIPYNSYGGKSLVWDKNTFYQNQQWKLNLNGTIESNHNIVGTWRQNFDKLHLTINDDNIKLLNNITKKKLESPRTIIFQNIQDSIYLHAFELSHDQKYKNKWYEIGRITIISDTSNNINIETDRKQLTQYR